MATPTRGPLEPCTIQATCMDSRFVRWIGAMQVNLSAVQYYNSARSRQILRIGPNELFARNFDLLYNYACLSPVKPTTTTEFLATQSIGLKLRLRTLHKLQEIL